MFHLLLSPAPLATLLGALMYSTAASVASQPQKGNNDAAPASSPPKPSSASPSLTDANPAAAAQEDNEQGPSGKTPKGLRFWLIIFSLLIATFLSALDLTSISTALPRIAEELESQDYSWIGDAYRCVCGAIEGEREGGADIGPCAASPRRASFPGALARLKVQKRC